MALFHVILRETTSGELSKGSLKAVLIHLLRILCVWGAGNSEIRFCFAVSTRNQALSFM